MKNRLFLTFFLIFSVAFCYANNLTIEDMQRIFSVKDWNSVNQIMAKKKWYYNSREEDQNSVCHEYSYIWSYKNSNYSESADGWLTTTISNYGKGEVTLIDYQVFDVEGYAEVMSLLEKNGYKLLDTENKNSDGSDIILTTYSNGKYLLESYISKESYNYDDSEWVPGYWVGGYSTEYDYYSGQYKRVWKDQKEYKSGHYRAVQKTGYITRYTFDFKKVGGIYDEANGLKYSVFENGNKEYECTLKDGIVVGTYKMYYPNGKLASAIKIQKDLWVIEEYKRNGELLSKFTVPIDDEQLRFGCKYKLLGKGYYSMPLHYLNNLLDKEYNSDKISYKIEGEFMVDIYIMQARNNCPIVDVHVWEKNLAQTSKYKLTKYEYDKQDRLIQKTITSCNDNKISYAAYDECNRIIEKGQKINDLLDGIIIEKEYLPNGVLQSESVCKYQRGELNGESVIKNYSENGSLEREQKFNYANGEKDGECITTIFLPNGIKTVETQNYTLGVLDGRWFKESYIGGKKQVDFNATYIDGKKDGEVLVTSNDTVIYALYNNGVIEHIRIFCDDMINYRSPKYITTDTTNLTLIAESSFTNGKKSGLAKYYYPGYLSDTINMIKGEHAGELQYTTDYDLGIQTYYSVFGTEYIDSTYKKMNLEMHYNLLTGQKCGLTTFIDSDGNLFSIENYKDDLLDGLSKYYQVSFCNGEYWAYFDNGIWTKSRYHNEEDKLIEIQKISLSQVVVLTFNKDERLTRKDFYLINAKTINGFNNSLWVNIFDANDTYRTGEYYIYDDQERVITYRKKDSNFIVHNDYDQKVTYWVHHANAVPEKFYELNTQNVMSGTIVLDNGETSEIIKVKKGYRDGVTKIINNLTGKTIQKVKYSKGVAK